MIYVPNLPHATTPVSVGWQFSTVMLEPSQLSSWVGILEQRRIGSEQTAIEVGIDQLRAVLPLFKRPVIVLADRWYGVARGCSRRVASWAVGLSSGSSATANCIMPLPLTGANAGRPANTARCWRRTRPETQGPADAQWEGPDEQGKRVVVSCWKGLHFREAPLVEVWVIRVQRPPAIPNATRLTSWFTWIGNEDLPLEQARPWYRKRFSQEHGYRFLKQDLRMASRRTCAPLRLVERWSWIVACACNVLLLCQQTGLAVLRPWESRQRPATPRRVRRVMPSILQQLGTPARPSKPREKSPGWCKGRVRIPAPRFAVVKKPKPVPQTRRKGA